MEKRILIIGIGNILLADEGFGPAAIEYLNQHYQWPQNVSLVDGATRGFMLMSEFLECDLAIVLDIVLGGCQPGTCYYLTGDDLDKSFASRESMHQTSLKDILFSCDLLGHKPETIIMGMEPYDWQSQQPWLTEETQKKLPEFCEKIVEELKKIGIYAEKYPSGE